jgi:hypothetical protein
MAALEQLVGLVTKVNATGFQLQERPGAWQNISKFADPAPALPEVGQRVRVGVDPKGFARTIEPMDAPAAALEVAASTPAATPRDVAITRLAVLKAAARFLADTPEAKSSNVLEVAERWEAWVTR